MYIDNPDIPCTPATAARVGGVGCGTLSFRISTENSNSMAIHRPFSMLMSWPRKLVQRQQQQRQQQRQQPLKEEEGPANEAAKDVEEPVGRVLTARVLMMTPGDGDRDDTWW
mmetsp:Transcript_77948/g.161911  ORF Transcript_77948/g.161911 Transcript_77948/m.161911 type:complete len:112 (+) Transcript_77948:185-520(+)